MSVDFDKIFSTNASSTPFTWSDSDYLVGWDSIENTPPSRQQFNALHMISDLKDQELNNVKAPKHSPVFTGDPQAPTPAKNDNDNSLATTAFVQTWVQDLESQISDVGAGITDDAIIGNGYAKFGNGFIIQWGFASTDSTGFGGGTFPIAFPTLCTGLFVSDDEASQGGWHRYQCGAPLPNSLTNYEVSCYDLLTGTGVADTLMWMAIGF